MVISGWRTTEVNTALMLLAGVQMIEIPREEKASVLKGQSQSISPPRRGKCVEVELLKRGMNTELPPF